VSKKVLRLPGDVTFIRNTERHDDLQPGGGPEG
jgi:hypothetical protein